MITPKQIFAVLSKKERLALIGALVVCAIAGVLSGIFWFYAKTEVVPAYGGTFREGIVGQPVFINPVMPATEIDRDISRLVFSNLSDLSESITYSEDGRIWNVRLKEGLTWHDHEPLTSDDVVFTVDTVQDPDSRSPLYASFQGVAAERISEREIQFVLQNPYAFFAQDHLQNLGIIPRHIFDEIPVQNYNIIVDGRHPVGSGPYTVADYVIDEGKRTITSIALESYDGYFGEMPYISNITLKFYKSKDELIKAYNGGDIDGFGLSTTEALSENLTIRNRLHFFKSPRYYALFINQSLAPAELQDINVRRALSGTIDRARIVSDIFQGDATLLYGPTSMNQDPSGDFDPALLAGLQLHIVVPAESFLERTAAIIKENWEAQGVEVLLETLSLKEIQENVLKNNGYEMILFGNIVKESQDLFSFWHSSRRFYPDQNLSLYQNSTVDTLLEEYRKSFDEEERKTYLETLSDEIATDIPAIFLYSPDYVYVAAPNVQGFNTAKPINTAADRFSDIGSWYIKTKRVFTTTAVNTREKEDLRPKEEKEATDEYFKELEEAIESTTSTESTP